MNNREIIEVIIIMVAVKSCTFTTMIVVLSTVGVVTAAAASSAPQIKGHSGTSDTSIEERLKNIEGILTRLDVRLTQDNNKLNLVLVKLDRLEKAVNSRSAHTQFPAERASNTRQRMQYRMQPLQQATEPPQEGREHYPKGIAGASGTQQATDHHHQHHQRQQKKEYDGMQSDTRRYAPMQQDATTWISKDTTILTTKMSSMYNDLWRRSLILEGLVKESLSLMNASRKENQDGFRSTVQTVEKTAAPPPQIEHMSNVIQRKLGEFNHKMDTKFQELMLAQNLFLDSCHRIQLKEPELETEITRVLDRLLDSLVNKTAMTFKELQTIQELIKSHDAHVIKAVARVNNAALMTGKEYKDSMFAIVNECRGYKDNVPNQRDGLGGYNRKLDVLLTVLQELQEQMTYTKNNYVEHISKSIDSNTIIEGVRKEIQSALKNLSISSDSKFGCRERVMNEERDSLLEKLSSLVERLQLMMEQLDGDDDEKYDADEEDNEIEADTSLTHKSLQNITDAKELIEKLRHINFEQSYEHDMPDAENENDKKSNWWNRNTGDYYIDYRGLQESKKQSDKH